jgi:hypothetical protein
MIYIIISVKLDGSELVARSLLEFLDRTRTGKPLSGNQAIEMDRNAFQTTLLCMCQVSLTKNVDRGSGPV